MIEQFLLDPTIIFLNHGSYGACPNIVFQEYQDWQRRLEQNPVEFLGRQSASLLYETRSILASHLGTSADRLVFLTNATTGVNTIAKSLHLQAGDEILTTDHEYGACNATWELICQQRECAYKQARIPVPFVAADFVNNFWNQVSPKTRVIFLSHLTSTTALIFPVREICQRARQEGILTIIDGAHAPGQIDLQLDEIGADFYIGNCHKWLMAPKGSAFLYARRQCENMVNGLVTSWGYLESSLGFPSLNTYTGETVLERRHQWQGTRDLAPFLAVSSALKFRYDQALDDEFVRCKALTRKAHDSIIEISGLEPIGTHDDYCQMVAIPFRCDRPGDLQVRLFNEYRIEVPFTSHAGQTYIRLSLQIYNNENDLDKLVSVLKKIT